MPKSYRLYDAKECVAFFNYIDSTDYEQKIKNEGLEFILKKGRDIHRGEGITLVT